MENTKKMTKVEKFALCIAAFEEGSIEYEFLTAERDALIRKSANRKPTAKQTANIGIKSAIVESMEYGKDYSVADIMAACPALEGRQNQYVSRMLSELVQGGLVVRTEVKRKPYFSLPTEDADEQ